LILSLSLADAMQHEPCGVLADADSLAEFVATDSILAVRQHPESHHPLVESKRRIFHDSSHLDSELLFADVAEPQAASLNERVLCLSTAGAGHVPAGPAELDSRIKGTLRVAEVGDCTLQRLEAFHA